MCCSVLRSNSRMGRSAELSDFERGLVISPVNAKRRLEWSEERRHWTMDHCKGVFWSDESRYTIPCSDPMAGCRCGEYQNEI